MDSLSPALTPSRAAGGYTYSIDQPMSLAMSASRKVTSTWRYSDALDSASSGNMW